MEENLTLFPVAGWDLGSIPAYEAIFVKLDFFASPMQSEPTPGRRYLLPLPQAKELAERILAICEQAESAGYVPPPGPRQ